MQVKTHVKAIFPRAIGPPSMQLAKQRTITADEKRGGESRSIGLERDIMITEGSEELPPVPVPNHNPASIHTGIDSNIVRPAREPSIDLDDLLGSRRLIEDLANAHPHQQTRRPNHESPRPALRDGGANRSSGSRIDDNIATQSCSMIQRSSSSSMAGNSRQDGRRREGCFTCKDRKKKCDTEYSPHEITRALTCAECERQGIECFLEKPDWADDPLKVKLRQEQRRQLIKLGKRKSRDLEGEGSGSGMRGRPGEREMRINFGGDLENSDLGRVNHTESGSSGSPVQRRVVGKGKAIRGGLGGRF
ncbi:hypothetical protein BKA65DRAFT_273914 [Rhexocercosporidium sp. MPI-PUGE-AT-0058]|nr:hypothetical protein BKA65DRAFT_273914 [Rhexocercosporidium sp. MPI-PUGE-AT-0058]